ncbi:MAG: hypothetical protein UX44_C0009G0008 [candidate division WWE3 bacterium GW2011_GWA1_46_21]|uniref:PT repeat-containing protein n=4 Tax=Katanobacteria TaxID=422282 RepID=A0A0G1RLW2_UNCKA|nr:MAG: hypothetical protein UX44_C0009G0008 [candidate division WWE3 bacterium GW2011_GWA1_46_21]KKU49167.1 MAG: hypothetical protein UX69_C0005G0027 [candidate division WWE3 bacterium GW2011_GWA2_46_9]KKU50880.1 MAG: hypothetical protein UX73_C0012G0025 [candidate division WWE3 bacterium GW2011_GWC1_47_10]KKU58154.1 MAG: hypothetical protein UX79_C0001G0050 [candidate division WWE3 bacterium GW2011_GWB1_47_11]
MDFGVDTNNQTYINGIKPPMFTRNKVLAIAGAIVAAALLIFAVLYFFPPPKGNFLEPLVSLTSPDAREEVVVNPLTGELYSKDEAREWINVRPLAVMINNHTDARPQAGLVYVDVVYEIVAEGGITRFLAFFHSKIPEKIGPIRSVREYYLVLVKELGDAMLMHIGWSPQALEAIETWPVRSLGRGGAVFWRENPRNVATEHTAYSNGKDLLQRGLELGWDGVEEIDPWAFKDDHTAYESAAAASSVSVDFWYKGDYSAIWEYDPVTNSYKRFLGYDSAGNPVPHIDDVTKEQLKFKNLIVQFAQEQSIDGDDKGRLDYKLVGTGNALIFLDGKVLNSTWDKDERGERTKFYDENGEKIKFNRGKFWISIVPDRNADQVVYQ